MDNLENALVDQKNQILDLINDGEYEQAIALLSFSARLWKAMDYDYKTREIVQRIKDEVREHSHLKKTKNMIDKLAILD